MEAGGTTGTITVGGGNIDFDPQFVSASDRHLQPTSPCIDVVDNTAVLDTLDIDGETRIFDGDENGTATVDMGFDEYHVAPPPPPPPPPPTVDPAVFDPATGELVIPEVLLEGTSKCYLVKLKRLDQPGCVFEMTSARKAALTAATATYHVKTGLLVISSIQIDGQARTYTVKMMKQTAGYVFTLTKAKKQ